MCRKWEPQLALPENPSNPYSADLTSSVGIQFTSDETWAAGLFSPHSYGFSQQLVVLQLSPPAEQPALHVVRIEPTGALCWQPGTHALLLLGKGRLSRVLVVVDAPPSVQHAVGTGLPASDYGGTGSLCAMPTCSAAVLLSCQSLPGQAHKQATLAVFDSVSLAHISTETWQLESVTETAAMDKRSSLHCSSRLVACVFGGAGTCVFAFDSEQCQLGKRLFWAAGLGSSLLSADGVYLAGIRDYAHQVLDARTGCLLHELKPRLHDRDDDAVLACSIAWAGHNQLHAGYSGENTRRGTMSLTTSLCWLRICTHTERVRGGWPADSACIYLSSSLQAAAVRRL